MEITVHKCVRKNDQTVFVKVTEQMETQNDHYCPVKVLGCD